MIKLQLTLLPLVLFQIFGTVNDFHRDLPQPVRVSEDNRLTAIKQTLTILGRDHKFAEGIYISAHAAGIDPIFWACNIETESKFKITAKSPKGYKGLGQTPKAAMKTGFETADMTYAACIYKEKISIAKGDKQLALALYKGGNNPEAKRCAEKVFKLYAEVKTKLNEMEKLNERHEG